MRSHILVATVIAALASLIVAASAAACELTDGSLQSVNGTYYEPHGPTVAISPGDTVTFTFGGLLPGATYTVTYNGQPIPYEEVQRWPAGAKAKFTVPDLGSGATDGAWKIEPVPGGHDAGTAPTPTELNVRYQARASTPAPGGGSSAPTASTSAPQPSSTGQPAGGSQPTTVVTQTTLSEPPPSGSPTNVGHISQAGGAVRHRVSHQQALRSQARTALVSASHPAATPQSQHATRSQPVTRTHSSRTPQPTDRTQPRPVAVPETRGPMGSARRDGGVGTAIVVASILLLFGLAGYGGTRVLARRTPPPGPEPEGGTTTTPAFDPIEAELQQMLAEEQVNLAGEERREAVPV